MKILVTGGMGFIGSAFIRRALREKDVEVVNLDILSDVTNPHTLDDVKAQHGDRYMFVFGDICDMPTVEDAVADVDAVVNLAAESHVDRSNADALPFVRTNVLGTQTLLQAAWAEGVKRFVHISTDEVLGPNTGDESFGEDAPLNPRNSYASTKAAAELLCRAMKETHGYPVTITRSCNNYGPYQHPEKFIPRAITNVLRGRPIEVYGKGKQRREWLHVEDNVEAIWSIVKSRSGHGQIYHLSPPDVNQDLQNISVARIILDEMKKSGIKGSIRFVKDRPGHDVRYSISSSITTLKHPDIEAGIRETVHWYTKNENWWRRFA